ncbi:MAG: DUF2804 domain-containing protein [Polyangiaceae bacterium]|nr:DUF2804 domain-containing protein [Polyangiaceae bacterium]MCW5791930.1 DUF2804 domain-containing protein [Polyangiaceae bacterium]
MSEASHGLPFEAPPARLVSSGAQRYGRFTQPPQRANLLDARYLGLPRLLRRARLKEWQAVQLSSEQVFMNVALFDAKLLGLVQVKLYDRARGVKHVFERQLPPGCLSLTDSLFGTRNSHQGRGVQLSFDNRLDVGRIHVVLDVAPGAGRPRITGRFSLRVAEGAPQSVSLPFARGGMYSTKGMFPVSGGLTIGDHRLTFGPSDTLATLDDHKGYYPRVMRWDWFTASRFGEDGAPRGFNLTANQCRDPERYNENCLWVGDSVIALPVVRFSRSAEEWLAVSEGGEVALRFKPSVPGDVRVNAGVIESRYQGPFGTFNGEIAPRGSPRVVVRDWFGMAEDFYLRC